MELSLSKSDKELSRTQVDGYTPGAPSPGTTTAARY